MNCDLARRRAGVLFAACALLCSMRTGAQQADPPSAESAPLVQAHFHHIGINTTDSYAAIAFYAAKFRARKEKFAGVEDAIWTGSSWLFFHEVDKAPGSEPISGIWHIGWGATDVSATYRQELASGTKFTAALHDISALAGAEPDSGTVISAFIDGPDHAMIEISTSANNEFDHVHLLSADPVKAGAWYARCFGFKVRSQQEQRTDHDMHVAPAAFVTADHVNITISPQQYIKDRQPDLWSGRAEFAPSAGRVIDHLGFSVPNVDEAIKSLQADGVRVLSAPRNLKRGVVRFALIEGPDHVSIEVIEDHSPAPSALSE